MPTTQDTRTQKTTPFSIRPKGSHTRLRALACRLTWRLRMLHYTARVQAAARAVTSQRRVLVFRGAAAEKRAQAIDLLRTCTRAHLSELVCSLSPFGHGEDATAIKPTQCKFL